MLLALLALSASTDWHQNPHAQSRLIVAQDQLVVGRDVIDAGIEFKVKPGWHVYWKNSGDAGFAPKVSPDHSGDVAETEISWPAPTRFLLRGGLQAFGYSEHVVYPIRLVLKGPAKHQVQAKLAFDYLVCEEECVPYLEEFALTLPVGAADVVNPQAQALLGAVRIPREGAIAARFADGELVVQTDGDVFVDSHPDFDFGPSERRGNDVRLPLLSKKKDSPDTATFAITVTGETPTEQRVTLRLKGDAGALWLMLLFGMLGGLILNLMPCVLPVLSLKLLGLVQHESERDARVGALWSIAGIMVSFVALALAVVGLGLAGWGAQFQEPTFVAFLALVVVGFALNLWGVFELPLPEQVGRLAGASARSHFFAGLFATLLATPCSAPFLGTAIAFALSSSPAVVVTMFVAVGMGMSLPYFALAAWPRAVHYLPKPGVWMVHLRQAMGFALAATSVWLLFVLAGQLAQTQVAFIELGLVLFAATLWLTQVVKARVVWGLPLLCAAAVMSFARSDERTAEGIKWERFDEGRLAQLQRDGANVFVDVTADWCFTCKVNERAVLASEAVHAAFSRCGVIAMKADWTKRDATIAAFLTRHGRTGIPFYLAGERVLPELLTEGTVIDAVCKPRS